MEGLFIFLEYSAGVKYTISAMRWIRLSFGNFMVLFSFQKANLEADINRKIKKKYRFVFLLFLIGIKSWVRVLQPLVLVSPQSLASYS